MAGIDISEVVGCSDLNLDPKRYSGKFRDLRTAIQKSDHFAIGDVLFAVPQKRFQALPSEIYHYIEIQRVSTGVFDYDELRGWQLPGRAKLRASSGDFFIAHIWGSAGTWFVAPPECSRLVVTNGFTRLRIRDGADDLVPDLIAGLCSELFCVQMRGFATGSDGLAEISDDDMLQIRLPKVGGAELRGQLQQQWESLKKGESSISKSVGRIIKAASFPVPTRRKSHCSLV
jgi:type I restriction enzyme M protein